MTHHDEAPASQHSEVSDEACVEEDSGSAFVWLLVMLPVLFAAAGLVFDGGTAISGRQRAANIAEQAARLGVDQLDLTVQRSRGTFSAVERSRAQAAACEYVAVAWSGARCSVTFTAAAGAEASLVTVEVGHQVPAQLLRVIGVNEFTVLGTGRARPAVGIAEEAAA